MKLVEANTMKVKTSQKDEPDSMMVDKLSSSY